MNLKTYRSNMGYRKKVVKATTNNITTGIINFLESKNNYAGRVNTTGVYDPVKKVYRKIPEKEKGKFDIYCCLYPSGKSLWIDIKKDEDKPSKYQLSFKKRIEKAGGFAIFIKTYDEFLKWYEENI